MKLTVKKPEMGVVMGGVIFKRIWKNYADVEIFDSYTTICKTVYVGDVIHFYGKVPKKEWVDDWF